MLVFAVPILAHDPEFTSHAMTSQLKAIQQCLWFILEPLITKNEYYCYGFYKNLVERMKSHKDALKPEDNEMNYVIIIYLYNCIILYKLYILVTSSRLYFNLYYSFVVCRNCGLSVTWR